MKHVIQGHRHVDYIAGGKALVDAGVRVAAHHRAKQRLERPKDPHTVLPDQAVSDQGRTIKLGSTTLELTQRGLYRSDSTRVMRLPKERTLFVVDTNPGGKRARSRLDRLSCSRNRVAHRGVGGPDRIAPFPFPGPGDRLGTRKDAEDHPKLRQTASAEKQFVLAQCAERPGCEADLPFVARRCCGVRGRGTCSSRRA